jgi:hypothetical protein
VRRDKQLDGITFLYLRRRRPAVTLSVRVFKATNWGLLHTVEVVSSRELGTCVGKASAYLSLGEIPNQVTTCIYVPVKRQQKTAPLPPHPNRGPRRFGLLPQASTVSSLHVQAGSQMEKTYSFSFPIRRIFLAIPFHHCRLKGDLSRIEVECEYVCFQELIPSVDAY